MFIVIETDDSKAFNYCRNAVTLLAYFPQIAFVSVYLCGRGATINPVITYLSKSQPKLQLPPINSPFYFKFKVSTQWYW